MVLIEFLLGLSSGVAISILLPQFQKVINPNVTHGHFHWRRIWESAMSTWREARPALIFATVILAIAIVLMIWQSTKTSEVSQLKNTIEHLISVMENNDAAK